MSAAVVEVKPLNTYQSEFEIIRDLFLVLLPVSTCYSASVFRLEAAIVAKNNHLMAAKDHITK